MSRNQKDTLTRHDTVTLLSKVGRSLGRRWKAQPAGWASQYMSENSRPGRLHCAPSCQRSCGPTPAAIPTSSRAFFSNKWGSRQSVSSDSSCRRPPWSACPGCQVVTSLASPAGILRLFDTGRVTSCQWHQRAPGRAPTEDLSRVLGPPGR